MNEHYEFYLYVQSYIEKNPECGAYMSDFVAKGIEKARKQANERAVSQSAGRCDGQHPPHRNLHRQAVFARWPDRAAGPG